MQYLFHLFGDLRWQGHWMMWSYGELVEWKGVDMWEVLWEVVMLRSWEYC